MAAGRITVGALAIATVLADAPPAPAASHTASVRVTATVVSSCFVQTRARTGPPCLNLSGRGAPPSVPPLVSYGRDAATGATVETIEF